jgi:hypothetical protein
MVVIPVDADVDEAEQVGEEPGRRAHEARPASAPGGSFSSSTMTVRMIMARTPSLNGSCRLVRMGHGFRPRLCSTVTAAAQMAWSFWSRSREYQPKGIGSQ